MAYRLTTILLSLMWISTACAQSNLPPFVAKLITHFESAPLGASPDAVWRYRYKDASVYYLPRLACCDIMSRLYDASGKLICHPDGGVAGGGDGKCSDFIAKRKDGEQLWSDPRAKLRQ